MVGLKCYIVYCWYSISYDFPRYCKLPERFVGGWAKRLSHPGLLTTVSAVTCSNVGYNGAVRAVMEWIGVATNLVIFARIS